MARHKFAYYYYYYYNFSCYLSLAVDTNDSRRRVVGCSDKDSVSTDTIHVDTGSCLNVVQVYIAVLCYHVDNVVLWTHLCDTIQYNKVAVSMSYRCI